MIVAGLMALPAMPTSFWDSMDSIMNAEEDQTGRAAPVLRRLINQGIQVFLENPITGIGAGQFKNYNTPDEVEKWRVTHNVWLQVAAELGISGLLTFVYLVMRAFSANFAAMRLLRHRRKRAVRQGLSATWPTLFPPDRRGSPHARAEREEHAGGDGRVDGLLDVRVGGVQLDVLLRAGAGGGGPRDAGARRAAVKAPEAAARISAVPRSRLIRVHA